jgi:glycerol-3-phosphate dehydrogenase
MDAEAVNEIAGRSSPSSGTEVEPLPGGESTTWEPFRETGLELGFPAATVEHLVRHYGTETASLYNLIRGNQALADPIHPDHPAVRAEVVHAVRRELAVRVGDVLDRRLRLTVETDDGGRKAAASVAELMGNELGWDAERREREVTVFLESLDGSAKPRALS